MLHAFVDDAALSSFASAGLSKRPSQKQKQPFDSACSFFWIFLVSIIALEDRRDYTDGRLDASTKRYRQTLASVVQFHTKSHLLAMVVNNVGLCALLGEK